MTTTQHDWNTTTQRYQPSANRNPIMCQIIKTRADLFSAMCAPHGTLYALETRTTAGTVVGYITSIEREDGSGRCFNVTIATSRDLTRQTVFVRFAE